MRSLLVASLLLFPLATTLTARASEPSMNAIPTLHRSRTTTGVVAAEALHYPKTIYVPSRDLLPVFPTQAKVDFSLRVDKRGKAHNIRLVNSDDPFLDSSALAEVHRIRWDPARLDHRAIGIPVDLTLLIDR